MKKFTNLKPKNEFDNNKDEILYSDDFLSIINYKDYSVIKEKDCVVCIPYLIETNQIVLRYEYIPSFDLITGQKYHLTIVCGSIEQGETPEKAMIRELEEEAGIVLKEDFRLEEALTPLFISKGIANKYYPYIIPLNERDYHEISAKGDGSKEESKSKSVKIDIKYLSSLKPSDLITDYMLLKLKEYLNLNY